MAREAIAIAPTGRASRQSARAAEVLTATRVIGPAEVEAFNAFAFGPNAAARNVDLPAVGLCAGVYLMVANTSTAVGSTIAVRDAAGATILTIPIAAAGAPKSAFMWCDGTAWYGVLGA